MQTRSRMHRQRVRVKRGSRQGAGGRAGDLSAAVAVEPVCQQARCRGVRVARGDARAAERAHRVAREAPRDGGGEQVVQRLRRRGDGGAGGRGVVGECERVPLEEGELLHRGERRRQQRHRAERLQRRKGQPREVAAGARALRAPAPLGKRVCHALQRAHAQRRRAGRGRVVRRREQPLGGKPRDHLRGRVQLVRKEGRDVSSQYGREGGGGGGPPRRARAPRAPQDPPAPPAPPPLAPRPTPLARAAPTRLRRRPRRAPQARAPYGVRDAACPISTG